MRADTTSDALHSSQEGPLMFIPFKAFVLAVPALIAANAHANFNLDGPVDNTGDDLHLLIG